MAAKVQQHAPWQNTPAHRVNAVKTPDHSIHQKNPDFLLSPNFPQGSSTNL
jgi:hypothetical protein